LITTEDSMLSSPEFASAARRLHLLSAALVATALAAGCGSTGGGSKSTDSTSSTAATPAPAPAAAAKDAKTPPPKSTAGLDATGRVVDSSKVESGSGKMVKGKDDWEGEITGIAAPSSKFNKLQIGMGMREAMDIAGPPTDQGAYVTAKAWIPWYFGSDKHRQELVYKGMGRLIFASGGGWGWGGSSGGNLVWIIHNSNEPGYR
jgi:hypothetical protein